MKPCMCVARINVSTSFTLAIQKRVRLSYVDLSSVLAIYGIKFTAHIQNDKPKPKSLMAQFKIDVCLNLMI